MILWKQTIEITPELKKLKGHNYKGRDIGPFFRLCNECKENKIEYTTYDHMASAEKKNLLCPTCTQKFKFDKNKKTEFFKKCLNEGCDSILYYKSKYYLKSSIRDNTVCKSCRNKQLSKMYEGKGFIGALKDRYEDGEERMNKTLKRRVKTQQKYWEDHPEELQELIDRRKNPKGKFYEIYGLRCQGNCERQYIEQLVKQGKNLPTKTKPILTTLGFYYPDFEFEDRYIEIKSTYTYELLKKDNNPQYLKIKEVASKIKPVEIIVNRAKDGKILIKKLITN